jgi:hypothetical protein
MVIWYIFYGFGIWQTWEKEKATQCVFRRLGRREKNNRPTSFFVLRNALGIKTSVFIHILA